MNIKRFFSSGLKIFASIILVVFLFHVFFCWLYRSTEMSGLPATQRLNYYLPEYDFVEKHKIVIDSSPEKVLKLFTI